MGGGVWGKLERKSTSQKTYMKESGENYAFPVSAAAIQIKFHKSSTCTKI